MKFKTRDLVLIPLFTAMTIIGAFIKIPVGVVPINLQFLFTTLSGVLLGGALGAVSQILYVALGLIGLPVFTSGGGLSYIFTPTFGYLIGYIFAAFIIGKITHSRKPKFTTIFFSCILGLIVVYFIGTTYLYIILNYVAGKNVSIIASIKLGVLMFIPGDIVKCIITALLGSRILPILNKTSLNN
ncbi:biotin synthase [Clostridium acetobutylicum]|nr:biotin synthase [Clostridium acetobutylicum]